MKSKNFYSPLLYVFLCILISSCGTKKKEPADDVIDLTTSTKIIRTLIHDNKLSKILKDHEPADLQRLINNISPAEMAFETEVLSCTLPVIVMYYAPNDTHRAELLNIFSHVATRYANEVKFVSIDVDALFVLAEHAGVTTTPFLLAVRDRQEVGHKRAPFDVATVAQVVDELIVCLNNS